MACDPIRDLLSAYLDGELDASERRLVEEHLRACAACAGEFAGLRRAVGLVKGLPREAAPAELARRVATALPAAEGRGSVPARSPGDPGGSPLHAPAGKIPPFRHFALPLAAAASLLVVLGVAFLAQRESARQPMSPGAPPNRPGAADAELASREAARDAAAPAAARAPETAPAAPPAELAESAPLRDARAQKVAAPAPDAQFAREDRPGDAGAATGHLADAPASPPAGAPPAPAAAAESVLETAKAAVPRRSDPFQPKLTPKKPADDKPSGTEALSRSPSPGAARAAWGDLSLAEEGEAIEPVAVLALHGGDPAQQAVLLDGLAYGEAAGQFAEVRKRGIPGGSSTLVYDLAPGAAARFLERLAAREDLRVAVERKLLVSLERGDEDAPLRRALDRLEERAEPVALAQALGESNKEKTSESVRAEEKQERDVGRKKADAPAEAAAASPAPEAEAPAPRPAAPAPSPLPPAGAGNRGGRAAGSTTEPLPASSSTARDEGERAGTKEREARPRRVRIVVRLIPR